MNKPLYACLTQHATHQDVVHKYGQGDVHRTFPAKAAFLKGVEWPANETIKVAFIKQPFRFNDGSTVDPEYTKAKADWVRDSVEKYITPLVNLKFEWDVPQSRSDVRIMFVKARGAWSYLGTQALSIPKSQPTMNLGWLDTGSDWDFKEAAGTAAVVIHEFGHCLGMIHELSLCFVTFLFDGLKIKIVFLF